MKHPKIKDYMEVPINPSFQTIFQTIKPQSRMIKNLRTDKNNNFNQMSKKRFTTLNKLSFYNEEMLLLILRENNQAQMREALKIRKLQVTIKHLKSLRHLDIHLGWIIYFRPKSLFRFFESLRSLKDLSVLHFYANPPIVTYDANTVIESLRQTNNYNFNLAKIWSFSKSIQGLRLSSNTEIKLSLKLEGEILSSVLLLLKGFGEIKNFTSIHLDPGLYGTELVMKYLLEPLRNSTSLTKVSLVIRPWSTKLFPKLESILKDLEAIKPIKYLTITLRDWTRLTYSELKKILPLVEKVAERSHMKIILEYSRGHPNINIGRFEWWRFKRSIKKLHSSHEIHAKHIGKPVIISRPVRLYCLMFHIFTSLASLLMRILK